MAEAIPLVATIVAAMLLTGCGVEEFIDRQPLPVGQVPRVTLAPMPRPYPDLVNFETTSTTDPPCDLPTHLCGLTQSAFSDD